MTNRRRFLQLAAGAAAGLSLGDRARIPTVPPAPAEPDEAYWRLVKASFPVRPGLKMMNAANLCPSPLAVAAAVTEMTAEIDADASFQNRERFNERRETARSAIARLVGADADEIAITRNTSEGNNTVVNGLRLGPGDEVVVWDENHPTNLLAWQVRSERDGFSVITVGVDPEDDPAAPFLAALSPRTRVLAFSHLSNASGTLLPAQRLCAEARSRGVLTLVDGAQTFGALRLDLTSMGCDFYTASSHKWFLGPKEAGVLFVRRDAQGTAWASDVGVGWDAALGGGARKFENLGQRDDACVAAMGAAAAIHEQVGTEVIERRVRELGEALRAGLTGSIPGVRFAGPPYPASRAGVVVFSWEGMDTRQTFDRLYREFGVAGAPMPSGVRLSPHIYNTLEDIHAAVEAAAHLASS